MAHYFYAYDDPQWSFLGNFATYSLTASSSHCRNQKSFVVQQIGPVRSICSSRDGCPPFIKNYHEWSCSGFILDFIPEIGVTCLIWSGSLGYIRKSSWHPNQTGGSWGYTGEDSADTCWEMAWRLRGPWLGDSRFPVSMSGNLNCPQTRPE